MAAIRFGTSPQPGPYDAPRGGERDAVTATSETAHTSSRFSAPSQVARGPVINPPTAAPAIPPAANNGKSLFACRVSVTNPAIPQR